MGILDVPKLSVVVPCYNEAESAPLLAERLGALVAGLSDRNVPVEFILVDDGSRDDTADRLDAMSRLLPQAQVVRHGINQGLGAALRTGAQRARGAYVATIDSDCTYDPLHLLPMLDAMDQGADLVLASPYHPNGSVEGVSASALFWSRGCSWLYRRVLGSPIHTFTSMFRIYRKDVLVRLPFRSTGFLCMAEILVAAIRQDFVIAEYPTVLRQRQFGRSKRQVARLVFQHLGLLLPLVVRGSRQQSAVSNQRQAVNKNRCPYD